MAKKGQKFREWTSEEKYKIIEPLLNYEKTYSKVAKENNVTKGMLSTWVTKYRENGIKGLENKRKPGNKYAKYYKTKKFKNNEEKLEFENIRLRIENELLKKGFLMKGDGSIVKFMK